MRPALAADDWDRLTEEPLPELDGEYPLSEAQIEGFWENGFIVLEGVLDRAEITAYGEAIRDVAMAHFRARGLALSFGGAFLQQLNLRYCSDAVRSFVQSPRFGHIASRLLRAPAVRLYHEQALFEGGLIPLYMTVATLGMLDTIWALVLPRGVQVFLVLLMLNFFRQVPKELQDAAEIDGAGKWRVLWQVYVPVSLPAIATITLFSGVFHWNSWFDGLIYANHPRRYPVQTYLQILLRGDILSQATSLSEISEIYHLSNRTVRSAYHRDRHCADPGAVPVPAALLHQGYRDRQREGIIVHKGVTDDRQTGGAAGAGRG